MKKTIMILILIVTLGMTMTANLKLKEIANRLPQEVDGWKKVSGAVYTPKTLFEYIDGGAELYISYNFQQMLAQKFEKEGEQEITLDIFDMENSYNAFGVFSHSREAVDHVIDPAVESEYASGLLTFWKGKFYISIMAYPETPEKKETVLKLGRKIAEMIKEKSQVPPIISKLPREDLVKESIRYFHHYIWLNSHFYISDDNILLIDKGSEAVLAKYREGKDKSNYYYLLISYPNQTKADAAYQSFMKNYLPDAKNGIKQLEDGRWTGSKIEGHLVKVVLNASSGEKVKAVLQLQ